MIENEDADQLWNSTVKALRKKLGFAPPSPAEAQAAWDAAPEIPLSQERIDEIVNYVLNQDGK